jgi:hypothetical protein
VRKGIDKLSAAPQLFIREIKDNLGLTTLLKLLMVFM